MQPSHFPQPNASAPPQMHYQSRTEPAELAEHHLKPVRNPTKDHPTKPLGGLWTCDAIELDTGEITSEWIQFWEDEHRSIDEWFDESTDGQISTPVPNPKPRTLTGQRYLIQPSSEARVYTINRYDELLALPALQPVNPETEAFQLDWEQIAQQYDAIRLTREGLDQMPSLLESRKTLAVWDIPSTVWFRWCFEQVKEVSGYVNVEVVSEPTTAAQPTLSQVSDRLWALELDESNTPIRFSLSSDNLSLTATIDADKPQLIATLESYLDQQGVNYIKEPQQFVTWFIVDAELLEQSNQLQPKYIKQEIMPPVSMTIASLYDAEQLLTNPVPGQSKPTHVISIGMPDEPPPKGLEQLPHLRLEFADTRDSTHRLPPQRHHVEQAIAFGRDVQAAKGHLLVHCQMGISRSSGIALAILADQMLEYSPKDVLQHLGGIKENILPNALLVRWTDELVGGDFANWLAYAKDLPRPNPQLEIMTIQEKWREFLQQMEIDAASNEENYFSFEGDTLWLGGIQISITPEGQVTTSGVVSPVEQQDIQAVVDNWRNHAQASGIDLQTKEPQIMQELTEFPLPNTLKPLLDKLYASRIAAYDNRDGMPEVRIEMEVRHDFERFSLRYSPSTEQYWLFTDLGYGPGNVEHLEIEGVEIFLKTIQENAGQLYFNSENYDPDKDHASNVVQDAMKKYQKLREQAFLSPPPLSQDEYSGGGGMKRLFVEDDTTRREEAHIDAADWWFTYASSLVEVYGSRIDLNNVEEKIGLCELKGALSDGATRVATKQTG